MEVTDIKIRLVSETDQLKAFATVVFDSVLVVHNIKVISTGEKLIIAMPSRLVSNGEIGALHTHVLLVSSQKYWEVAKWLRLWFLVPASQVRVLPSQLLFHERRHLHIRSAVLHLRTLAKKF